MDRTSLPHSASPLPMFMLIGVASLGAGLVLRRRLA
jgi:LPXTG-motif cell wall-anchored protein